MWRGRVADEAARSLVLVCLTLCSSLDSQLALQLGDFVEVWQTFQQESKVMCRARWGWQQTPRLQSQQGARMTPPQTVRETLEYSRLVGPSLSWPVFPTLFVSHLEPSRTKEGATPACFVCFPFSVVSVSDTVFRTSQMLNKHFGFKIKPHSDETIESQPSLTWVRCWIYLCPGNGCTHVYVYVTMLGC